MDAFTYRGTTISEEGKELVPCPQDATLVYCRWVYTVKDLADGSVDRFQARLVAKGFTKTDGIDDLETFSPVARVSSIRMILSFAVNHSWPLSQLDIHNAFLYGDLTEEVYMREPPCYVTKGERVCRLRKAIYGLKQSPRVFPGSRSCQR
jgi:hypothetical protein